MGQVLVLSQLPLYHNKLCQLSKAHVTPPLENYTLLFWHGTIVSEDFGVPSKEMVGKLTTQDGFEWTSCRV